MRHAHRQRARLLAAVIVVVLATSLAAGLAAGAPAGAQTPDEDIGDGGTPVTQPPQGADGTDRDAPAVCDRLQPGCTAKDVRSTRQIRSLLGLDEDDQEFPLSAYEITCDEGGLLSFTRKFWCVVTAAQFAVGKWSIGIGIDVLSWALEFRVAEALRPLAHTMSRAWDATLVSGLQLRHVAWTLALAVAGWHLLRARLAASVRELATTVLIGAIGALVVANPGGYLAGSVDLAQNSAGAVVEAVNDIVSTQATSDAATAADVRDQLAGTLRRSFVAEPYDWVNWGGALTGDCAEARDAILEGSPFEDTDRRGVPPPDEIPRFLMENSGCGDEADFNAKPSDDRAAGAFAMMAASVLATVLLVVIGLGVFAAQLTLVFLWSATSLVWTIALAPGGRGVLWHWLGRLAWSILVTVASLFVVSWLALTVTTVLNVASDLSMLQRLVVVLVIVLIAYKLRSGINHAVSGVTQRFADRMRRITPNESDSGLPAVAAGAGAFTLGAAAASSLRDTAGEIPGGTLYLRRQEYKFRYRYIRARPGIPPGPGGSRGGGIPTAGRPKPGARVRAAIARSPLRYVPGHRILGRVAGATVGTAATSAKTARTAHRGATNLGSQVRHRLAHARANRSTDAHNVADPVDTIHQAHQQATGRARQTPNPRGPRSGRSPREPDSTSGLQPAQHPPSTGPRSRPASPRYQQLALDLPPRTKQLRLDLGHIPETPRRPSTATEPAAGSEQRPRSKLPSQRPQRQRQAVPRYQQLALDLPQQLRFDLGQAPDAPPPAPSATQPPRPEANEDHLRTADGLRRPPRSTAPRNKPGGTRGSDDGRKRRKG